MSNVKKMHKWNVKAKNHVGKDLNAEALKVLHYLPYDRIFFKQPRLATN